MNELVQRLLADGRQEDLLQATADAGFRRKLLAEYKIGDSVLIKSPHLC